MTTVSRINGWRSTTYLTQTILRPSEVSAKPVGPQTIVVQKTETRTTSENIPGWRQRLSQKKDATTSLVGVRYTHSRYPFHFDYRNVREIVGISGIYGLDTQYHPVVNSGTVASRAEQLALQKFTKKARQRLHTWQGGVFAGEFRETVRMLKSPTKRLRSYSANLVESMLNIKRRYRHWKRLAEAGKTTPEVARKMLELKRVVADTWLEWSFGVKPTIQDCNDAVDAFRQMAEGDSGESIRITGSATDADSRRLWSNQSVTFGYSGLSAVARGNIDQDDFASATVRAVWVSQKPSGDMPLPIKFGVDLSSIVPTAYELVPYSWLVDYFTSVGSAIDAWSIRLVDFAWSNRTIRNRRTVKLRDVQWEPANSPFSSGAVDVFGPYLASMSRYEVSRQKGLPPVETAGFYVKVPGTNSTKWLNLAAFLSGISEIKRR